MSLHQRLSQLLRLPLSGPLFKLYARPRRWPNSTPAPSPPHRILLVNLMPALGDTICYMASLELLRAACPDAHITWLADSSMSPLIAQHPALDRVLTISTPPSWLLRIPTLKSYYRLFTIARGVQALQIDEPFHDAVVLRGGCDPSFSAHAIWLLRLPRSIGYSHRVEPSEFWHNFGDTLLTDVETTLRHLHEAARPVHLLHNLGLIPKRLDGLDTAAALPGLQAIANEIPISVLLEREAVPSAPFLVLAPGASLSNRAWPSHCFQVLCQKIIEETDFNVVLVGNTAERALCESIAAASLRNRVYNTAGRYSLTELTALLSHASGFVGNDSGPGHVAGALGVPVVSLHSQALGSKPSHPRSPSKGRPLGPRVIVLQPDQFLAPCSEYCKVKYPHCIAQVPVSAVWDALQTMLNASGPLR